MLKVLSVVKINMNRQISVKKEILDLLSANIGDEILFILDEDWLVNIRKFERQMILGKKRNIYLALV